MSKLSRDEDIADKWLREHDPYYTDTKRNKRKKKECLYDTPQQERRRREMEIPISSLSRSQRVQFKRIAGAYTEKGDFEL